MYLGDFAEDGDIFFKFTTRIFATGIPGTLAGTPVLSVYKDEGGAATEKTTAETYFDLDVDHDSIVGFNNVRVDLSGDAFFATGADYSIVITTGTVSSVSVIGEVVATFSIENRSIGQPAGATLAADVVAVKAETASILAGTVTNAQGADVATDVAAMIDGNNRVDVGSWLGTAVSAQTAGTPDVNVEEINNNTIAVHTLRDWMEKGTRLTADSGTTTTLVDAGLTEADDFWNDSLLVFRTGTNSGRTALVLDFDAASDTLIFTPAVPDAVTTEGFALIPGLGRANVQAWLGTAAATPTTAGVPEVDMTHVSGATQTAGDIIATLGGLSGATGGSVSIGATLDNVLTGISINNGGAAVDKSTSPATVGIPVTGHGFVAGQQVTLANTVAYNASVTVDSVSTNEVVIVSSFTGETFGADDIISSTVKTIGFIGSQQSGTFASTEAEDGVLHDIDDVSDDIDIVYTFRVGGGRVGTEIVFAGFVQGNGDIIAIEVYDHVGDDWEVVANINGTNGTVNVVLDIPLLLKHTGSGADLGDVYVRFDTNSTTPSNLSVDRLLVEAINTGQTIGYAGGQIWIDTGASNTNTETFVDGVADRPVSTIAAAKTLSTSLAIGDFHVINGSSFTLAESTANESYFGDNWTLALGSQATAGAHFEGAIVSGVQTGSNVNFTRCLIGTVTVADNAHFDVCGLEAGTMTLPAGAVLFERCYHAGTSVPILDFGGAVGSTTVHMHGYSGGLQVNNMGDSGTDIMHLDGSGKLLVDSSGSGGTINVRGNWEIINNGSAVIIRDDTAEGVITGTAATGTLAVGSMTTNLVGYGNDQLIGRIVTFLPDASADADGEIVNISDYASANGLITFAADLTTAPADGDRFKIT